MYVYIHKVELIQWHRRTFVDTTQQNVLFCFDFSRFKITLLYCIRLILCFDGIEHRLRKEVIVLVCRLTTGGKLGACYWFGSKHASPLNYKNSKNSLSFSIKFNFIEEKRTLWLFLRMLLNAILQSIFVINISTFRLIFKCFKKCNVNDVSGIHVQSLEFGNCEMGKNKLKNSNDIK